VSVISRGLSYPHLPKYPRTGGKKFAQISKYPKETSIKMKKIWPYIRLSVSVHCGKSPNAMVASCILSRA
jgi:hypothetical protein